MGIFCLFGFHKWKITFEGPMHLWLLQLHTLADTEHECEHCGKVRSYVHVSSERLYEMAKRKII